MTWKASALIIAALATHAATAQAAYRCELFDRAENAPGGDIPALVKFTDSNDFDAAKAACAGLVDKKNVVDYWLKWIEAKDLPGDWKAFDLLVTAGQPQPTSPTTQPAAQDGYACIVYDSEADRAFATKYVSADQIAAFDLKVDTIAEDCKALMRTLLPNHYRDFELKYLDKLPADASANLLYEGGC